MELSTRHAGGQCGMLMTIGTGSAPAAMEAGFAARVSALLCPDAARKETVGLSLRGRVASETIPRCSGQDA